ncbi:Cof-type HAD-IIB family hydrolase [Clostridium vitabionis]|jgi:Cof subfamily protein (haloacid dehalogenase superfamily)|uniref:Cof-type HAD-IIB family hydrolase n=1 Tax=Clostridium vitabionis TaxID=2784388 RepID=UPI00188B2D3B|nr:HAD family hydrolase [Clostridium vitabionis]
MIYIFADIDGTIRQFDGSIAESTVTAIHKLRENGCKVLICSGRPEAEIEQNVLDIGFDGIVSSAGARVTYEGKCVVQRTVEDSVMQRFVRYASGHEYLVVCQNHRGSYILRRQLATYTMISNETQKRLGETNKRLLLLPAPVDTVEDLKDTEKFMFFGSVVPTDALTWMWTDQFDFLPFSFPCPVPYGGEGSIAGVDKGYGIRELCRAVGADLRDTIAIGDSGNDIPMLKTAGRAIAMGNGTPDALNAADMVTDNIGDDGFANAFRKLGFI